MSVFDNLGIRFPSDFTINKKGLFMFKEGRRRGPFKLFYASVGVGARQDFADGLMTGRAII